MPDLFDDEPAPNSPEDLGGYTPRRERRAARQPKPWEPEHPAHPSQRPINQLHDGEEPPTSWNVAETDLGIQHMRTFLEYLAGKGIESGGHTVGTLYCGLNAHSLDGFRWLTGSLVRCGFERLPSIGAMDKAIKKRDAALLYSDGT